MVVKKTILSGILKKTTIKSFKKFYCCFKIFINYFFIFFVI
ncbi:Hypothetical Protein SLY_0036 [Strawberry lethal yellows phytoplasma (CPA) str. NZSb11]|uniref:Uncharacterized protein n=1 Tax=Strawberry lethal yellows phytoplasma (CPA) str. NZSb11 TaxID=980422 RepID=R4RVV3_PHYAS|nr:Hypothetical Protein SLY_0036 [Strawberry lethal yellows phytoplasma (CPA) str. NZSb11]